VLEFEINALWLDASEKKQSTNNSTIIVPRQLQQQ
jgi:hypothetical protein